MKLLYTDSINKIEAFEKHVRENVCGDYIYDYPPRQAYRPLDINEAETVIVRSLSMSDELNLYYHFPFCKQICSYCNLFAICESNMQNISRYFDALKKETETYLPYIKGKKINSLYLGGGTPSLIDAELFADFLDYLQKNIGFDVKGVPEVAMEMSPDTATSDYLSQLVGLGINRVNIGVQAVDDSELFCIGRKYERDLIYRSLENVMRAGFNNVCVDLIYGLQNQSMESWERSVADVVSYGPPTICAYPLTLRDNTGFSKKGYLEIDGEEQYKKYCFARDYLLTHGYVQETHVRYKKEGSNGGYVQKENHWNQQNILGMGAGARSYLKLINTRNGYSVLNRRGVYEKYINDISKKSFAITDGYIMSEREMMAKHIVLGLDGLSLELFKSLYGAEFRDVYPEEYKYLLEKGYIELKNGRITLTVTGTQYRDLIVQMFFTDEATELVKTHSYNE